MRIVPKEPKRGSEIITARSQKTCKHASKYTVRGSSIWMCYDCGRGLKPVICIMCDGTGSQESRSGALHHCRPCNGSGIRSWKLIPIKG